MRRARLAGVVAAAAVAVAAVAAAAVAAPRADLARAHAAMVSRLQAKHLSYRWVACVQTGRRYRSARVIRCNVNYGDPHIVAYCGVLRGARFVTQLEAPAIPCGADRAGWSTTIVSG